jgi:hypothetical protein
MPLAVWFFFLAFSAVVFAMFQATTVIIPNSLRVARILRVRRPQNWEDLRINSESLIKAGTSKVRHQVKYWFSDSDCDLPKLIDYKKSIRKAIKRIVGSFAVALIALIVCGTMLLMSHHE